MAKQHLLDELDRRMVRALTRDGRASARALSKKLGVATSTVVARMNRLERKGIVTGYSASLDHERLGFQWAVLIEVSARKGRLVEAEEKLAKLPGVLAVYDITGVTDCAIIAKFRSREELDRFVKELQELPSIERTVTHLVLNAVKEDYNSLNFAEL